jgi:hypothetical protein
MSARLPCDANFCTQVYAREIESRMNCGEGAHRRRRAIARAAAAICRAIAEVSRASRRYSVTQLPRAGKAGVGAESL